MGKFLFSLVLCFLLAVPAFGFEAINEHIKDEMIEKCTNATKNRVEAEGLVMVALRNKENCESSIFNAETFSEDVNAAAKRGDTMASIYHMYCKKADHYFTCSGRFYDYLNKCLDKEGLEEVTIETNALKEAKNYICSDEGRLLERFTIRGGVQCIQSNTDELTDCFISAIKDSIDNEKIGNGTKADMCVFLSDVEKCIMPKLRGNCNEETTQIFLGLFNQVVHRHLCGMNGVDAIDLIPRFGIEAINEHMRDQMIEQCTKATKNRVEAESLVKVALRNKETCESSIFNSEQYREDVKAAEQRGDTMVSVYHNYCQKADHYFTCNSDFYDFLNKCLDKEGLEEVTENTNVLKETKNYFCSEEGRLLERFRQNDGFGCIRDKMDLVTACMNGAVYNKETGNGAKADMCLYFNDVEKCAMPILKQCRPETTPIFQGLFNDVVHRHLCEKSGVNANGLSKLAIIICIFIYSIFIEYV